ncbi:hypothetical protein HY993_02080 [Candidatus Micrarchaeota archaeon]|nr:hypothetical protein [Candidatus Micrarchaeota archaeon]
MPQLPESIWRRRLENEFLALESDGSIKFESNFDKTSYVISINSPALHQTPSGLSKRFDNKVQIDLKRDYPYPGGLEVAWLTPIFHPNIRQIDGKVCIRLLNKWSASQTLTDIVKAIQSVLENPNPDDPLDREAADYFRQNPDAMKASAAPEFKKPRIIIR